ncbi:MAG: FG-GAP-like repeat-containing protein [Flavobacteriales bacterium]|nr:FG-GAP-like repeat-containing protein [Flavobacteriales bacterium]
MTRYALLTVLCLPLLCAAQTFQNMSTELGIQAMNADNLHGAGVSTADFDQDGDHDITFCLDGEIKVFRNDNGNATLVPFGFEVEDNAKHPTWVDFDNDGDLDFYFSQMFGRNKLYRNDNLNFSEVSIQAGLGETEATSYGCSWGDYDNDGDLDLYQCTYLYVLEEGEAYEDWTNQLYQNNGDGTFTNVTEYAGVGDGIQLSFQSIWCDFDHDGWQDLYVINDLEHPNGFYHNNGDGTFTEIGEENGSAMGPMDAMSATPGDFNRDGYEDIFITNVQIMECALLINQGDGTFVDMADESNVTLSMLTWGASAIDYDNDCDLDIYVCENNYLTPEMPNPLLKNNGNLGFVNIGISTLNFDFHDSYSVACMDWNNDGSLDMAVSNFAPQNAAIWISTGNDHRFIDVKLEGTISNPHAVGALVKVWSNSQLQTKRVYCGQNYLAQEPYDLHFGLDDAQVVDSLEVIWPSGWSDKWYGLSANQTHELTEGSTFPCSINSSDNLVLCEGESITLTAVGDGIPLWNNESTTISIEVNEPGVYSVELMNDFGLIASAELAVDEDDLEYEVSIDYITCFNWQDGVIDVSMNQENATIEWSNEEETFVIDSLDIGIYSGTITSEEGCTYDLDVFMLQPDTLELLTTLEHPGCFDSLDGSINVIGVGGTGPYTIDTFGADLNALPSGSWPILLTDSNGCETMTTIVLEAPPLLEVVDLSIQCNDNDMVVELQVTGGEGDISFDWSDGTSYPVFTGPLGDYELTLIDENGCTLEVEGISCPFLVDDEIQQILIYPNPTNTGITIASQHNPLALYSSDGRLIQSLQVGYNDLSGLAAGIYYILSEEGITQRIQLMR